MEMKIKIEPLSYMPTRAHSTDAGLDLYSPVDAYIPPQSSECIDTGVHIELPSGTVGLLKSKSGLNVKHGIVSEGVIDEGYVGTMVVKLYNHSLDGYTVHRGDKITQLLVMPCMYVTPIEVNSLEDTERGSNGFGSTGK